MFDRPGQQTPQEGRCRLLLVQGQVRLQYHGRLRQSEATTSGPVRFRWIRTRYRVFKFTSLCLTTKAHFIQGQYLLADSAYTPQSFCVPLFERSHGEANLGGGELGQTAHLIVVADYSETLQ